MSDVAALYQKAILEHGNHPKNEGELLGATHRTVVHNPLCGDRITLALVVHEGRIVDARFEAKGCLIAKASASILTESIRARSEEEALSLETIVHFLISDAGSAFERGKALVEGGFGPLAEDGLWLLRGAANFPARKACVLLPWNALLNLLVPGT